MTQLPPFLKSYWALVKTELLTQAVSWLLGSCQIWTPDPRRPCDDTSAYISIRVYISYWDWVTNKVRRLQPALHHKWYIKNTVGIRGILALQEKVTAIPPWETLSSTPPCEGSHWLQGALESQRLPKSLSRVHRWLGCPKTRCRPLGCCRHSTSTSAMQNRWWMWLLPSVDRFQRPSPSSGHYFLPCTLLYFHSLVANGLEN